MPELPKEKIKAEEKTTVEEVRLLLNFMSKGYNVPEIVKKTVYDVAVKEIEEKGKVVIAKRDPNIQKGNIQGYFVKIVEGNTIRVHPVTVGSFNADFDGDTYALYTPLSEESQGEVRERMISAVGQSSINDMNFRLNQEMFTGIFTLTATRKKFPTKKPKTIEEVKQFHIGQPVKMKFRGVEVETTAGRIIFNDSLPKWYSFVNDDIDKKTVERILKEIINRSKTNFAETIDKLMKIGFFYSTIYPKTFSLDMSEIPPQLEQLKLKLSQAKTLSEQSDIIEEMERILMDYLKRKNSDLYYMVKSGAARGSNQIRQILVCKGLIADPQGNPLPPITDSFSDGYSVDSYFEAAAGSRKGTIDRSLNTKYGGYAYRKIVFVCGDVTADIETGNCGTKLTLDFKLTKELFLRMSGRYVQDKDGKISKLTERMVGQVINLRSPIFCLDKSICRTCYGDLIKQITTPNVGIVAAQEVGSLSEKIMKGFHLGGALILEKLDIISELMENIDDLKESKIRNMIRQKGDDLICISPLAIIEIDKILFKDKNKIIQEDNKLILPVGYFTLTLDDEVISSTIEQRIDIYIPDEYNDEGEKITLTYGEGDKVLHATRQVEDYTKVAQQFDSHCSGKSPFTDVPSLYKKFWKAFGGAKFYDSVHLEVVISNILRSKKNPQKPARLVRPYDYEMYPIKTLPNIISWPLGLCFEDFGKALSYGLVSDRGTASPIEKILFGEELVE